MNEIASYGKAWARAAIKAVLPKSATSWIRVRRRKNQDRKLFRQYLRPTDVFLVGHPKSGNTWLAYMLGIAMQGDREGNVTLANIGKLVPTIHVRDQKIRSYEHLRSPRVFRNEGPVYPESYPKTIYLTRDPRAVLLSYYHHCVHDTAEYQWPLEDFVEEMLTYGCIKRLEPYLVRWDVQVLEWLDRAKQQPVKMVKYEDMVNDRRGVLGGVIDFTGINCDKTSILTAVQRSDFKSMRQDEERNGAESYPGEKGRRGYFIRTSKSHQKKICRKI